MQSVTTSHSATQERDIGGAIVAVWRRAMELVLSIGGASHARHSPTIVVDDTPERPWYDDPSAGRGL